ncbi:uncharacterized protein O3C94_018923 [Discoglossus pictus]
MDAQRAMDEIKKYICNFSLDKCAHGNQGYNRVLLQLFGYMGHGKSSLINSCKYVIRDGEYKVYAKTATAGSSVTKSRTSYKLTGTITLVDNRGCATMNSFETGEVYAQLGNFLPLDQPVVWTKGFDDMMTRLENSEMDPNFTDFIVPIFVYSCKKAMAEEEKEEIKNFLFNCRKMTGFYPIIVLTHKTSGDFYEMEKAFRLMGAEQVMKIDNYTAEDHLKSRGKHSEILKLLYNVLEDVNFRMREIRNPIKERIERKKFLLKFAHDQDIARRQQQRR